MRIFPDITPQEEFNDLGALGHKGNVNDRQFKYLRAEGYAGALADMMYALRQGGGGGATPTPANFSAVDANGWQVTYSSPPTFDPSGDPEIFTVTRQGYNASGSLVDVDDTLTMMSRLRQPFPNQATLTTDQALSDDFIYSSDVVAGSVTNNSTRAYPKPIAMWLTQDKQIIESDSMTVQLAVAHAHARSGRPVAAVTFSVSDGTTTATATVSSMTTRSCPATSLAVPCFEGTLDVSGMTQGATLTIDAVIYPWVGDAFTISTDADAYPSPNLTTLRALCNRTGAYGRAYAYVDPVGGNDGTAVVSETAATAQAAPYATFITAAAAIKTYNNANLGRNNADGGIVRFEVGTTTLTGSWRTTASTDTWPITLEAANAANIATTIFRTTVSYQSSTPNYVVVKNLTLLNMGGNVAFFDSAATTAAPLLVFDSCDFAINTVVGWDAWLYRTGRTYFFDCSGEDAVQHAQFSTVYKACNYVGSNFCGENSGFSQVGCKNVTNQITYRAAGATLPETRGMLIGWNHLTRSNAAIIFSEGVTLGDRGMAVVNNVIEMIGGQTAACMQLWADNNVNAAQNIVVQNNTIVGSRLNIAYQDIGSVTIAKTAYVQNNVFFLRNTKTDVFGANANLIGNWSNVFSVGWRYNALIEGSSDGNSVPGTGRWLGEVVELGSAYGSAATPLVTDFTDDQSFEGGNAGGGDYSPGASSAIPQIPSARLPYPVDLYGTTTPTDGTAYAGAVQ